MSQPDKIYALNFLPGIQRDGTQFSSRTYIDGQWCRWYRGLPKKMGGYVQITANNRHAPRGVYVASTTPNFDVYVGDQSTLQYIPIDSYGSVTGTSIDRTPALFQSDVNNLWDFDVMFSTVDNGAILVAHAAPNLSAIDSEIDRPIWYGELSANTPLIPTGFSASGGIVVLHPYLFIFGTDGNVIWTAANDPTTEVGNARITAQKIVAGLNTRGGNSSPAGLLWSLDSLIRVTFTGPTVADFTFDTVTSESSMLSSQSVIEYDGIYYWSGVDRFLAYNGIVQEIPNNMSLEYFFSNVNMAQRQKVWATKVTKWGEIWWFFPTGNSTECNHALIYNVREKTWYDTTIARSSGYFDQTFSYPIWADNTPNADGFYPIWMHENGLDQNVNNVLTAIPSYFETGDVSWCAYDLNSQRQDIDRWTYLYRVEPDLIQAGNMTLVINGKDYARSPLVSSTITWSQWASPVWSLLTVPTWSVWGDYTFSPTTAKIDMREQRRQMTIKFVSNCLGGNYELGQTLMVARIGDARQAAPS